MIARIMRPQTADRVDRIRGGDRYLPELSCVGVGDSEEIVGFVSMLGKKLPRRNFGMASSTSPALVVNSLSAVPRRLGAHHERPDARVQLTRLERHIGGMPRLEMGRAVGDISRAPNGGLRADPSAGASESTFDRVLTSQGSSLGLSLERVVTGVWVEYHRGPTSRQPAGHSRAPGRRLDVVRRSAWCPNQS